MTEERLREQLHRVDELTPPDAGGFDERALAAGQRRLAQRRTWSTGLLGAAAAVVIGTLIVVNVPQHSGVTSSVAGAAPERQSAQPAAPGSGDVAPGQGLAGPTADAKAPASPTTVVARAGDPGFAWDSAADALARVRTTLTSRPYDEIFTGVVVRPAPEAQATYYLTRLDPAAMAVVTEGVPRAAPIAFVQSAYSATACSANLDRVRTDVPALRQGGFPVADVACDDLGRVRITLGADATDGQRTSLRQRYGDIASVG